MENHIEKFKSTMNIWENYLHKENKIKKFLDENGLIFFFKKDNEIYGSNEDGRMAFATMNDKEESKVIKNEIRVLAINLQKSIDDDKSEKMFNKKDMKNAKVIDREEAEKELHEKIK